MNKCCGCTPPGEECACECHAADGLRYEVLEPLKAIIQDDPNVNKLGIWVNLEIAAKEIQEAIKKLENMVL